MNKNFVAKISIVPGWLSRRPVALGGALLAAMLLPLNLLALQPFHHDEALYSAWALEIVSGHDPWLARTVVDKPPLFLYLIAGSMRLLGATETAARIPSLAATVFTVGLTFWLGRELYDHQVGLVAAWLVALSPFTILFAPTALTDPLLVALVLAGCLAATKGRAAGAAGFLGLAIAAKQQGLFFAPLIVALLISGLRRPAGDRREAGGHRARLRPHISRFTFGLGLVLLPLLFWILARPELPGFWEQGLVNYGGLATDAAGFSERWWGFVALLQYGTASPILNTLFVIGLPALLSYGVWSYRYQRPGQAANFQPTQMDWLFFVFIVIFLSGHAFFSFQIWDRYLLGLTPLLALLLARVLLLPWSILKGGWLQRRPELRGWVGWAVSLGLVWLLAATLPGPAQDAANARYPLGSNSNALRGLEQIVAYLQGQVGANHTLYHRWLGPHWRFYLWGYPYDLQYWSSPQALAAQAQPGHLIAFPSWRSETEARLALAGAGLELRELARAYHPAGYPSIILYRIETVEK